MSVAAPEAIAGDIDILVEARQWSLAAPDIESVVRDAAVCALAFDAKRQGGALSILLADDATVKVLNRQFLGADKPTNVLSFPAPQMAGPRRLIGDIVLAYETVAREAEEQGKPLRHHASHLIVHGVLHLFGLDHGIEREAEAMEALETRLLARLGIPDPYRHQQTGD